ncbi:MAG: MBL fold metallo-hydrolase, partial [Parcubacteria group bacterium]|nr:MBL fold metallo-hydrolase [Parcubacteria group bacterium]
ILIDGGPDSKIIEKLDQNIPFSDNTIELVMITHPHEDHIAGLVHVLEKYKIEQILYTDVFYDSNIFVELKSVIEEKNIQTKFAKSGQVIKLNQANLYVLFPNLSYNKGEVKEVNNTSIVSKLVYGSSSFLFTGDAEEEVETELIDMYANNEDILDSDLIKVGHHGSKSSSMEDFLFNVSPKQAVVLLGENNRYKHPHPETLSKINDLDINLFRTDENGDIKCVSNGENIECN